RAGVSCLFLSFFMARPPPRPTLFPYTTLFRSRLRPGRQHARAACAVHHHELAQGHRPGHVSERAVPGHPHSRPAPRTARSLRARSEEHTSELQSRGQLVCRLLLEKKKKNKKSR